MRVLPFFLFSSFVIAQYGDTGGTTGGGTTGCNSSSPFCFIARVIRSHTADITGDLQGSMVGYFAAIVVLAMAARVIWVIVKQ